MRHKLPILLIIPHGGRQVPDELSGYEQIDEFGIFIESDVYANEIFNFDNTITKVSTVISRLFVDCDRSPKMIPPLSEDEDGVIKKQSILPKRSSGVKFFLFWIKTILMSLYTAFTLFSEVC